MTLLRKSLNCDPRTVIGLAEQGSDPRSLREVLEWLMVERTSAGEVCDEARREIRDLWADDAAELDNAILTLAGRAEDIGLACYVIACREVGVEPQPFAVYARAFEDFECRLIVMHGDRVLYKETLNSTFGMGFRAFRELVAELVRAFTEKLRGLEAVA